nr:hypothetical protein [Bacteroidota bacterium]
MRDYRVEFSPAFHIDQKIHPLTPSNTSLKIQFAFLLTTCLLLCFPTVNAQQIQQFTTDAAEDLDPCWSQDGDEIAF